VPAHEFSTSGTIDNRDLIPVVEQLAETRTIREVVYDPRYLDTIATMLAEAGFDVADVWSNQGNQAKTWQAWRDAVDNQTVAHAGDRILATHVCGAQARETDSGWKVSKLAQQPGRKIDGLVVVAAAHWRCQLAAGAADSWAEAW
jgi:phage terminase large subunit-like protein